MMRSLLVITASLSITACVMGPDYHGPPAVAGDATARGNFVRANDAVFIAAPGVSHWWETLNDPLLTKLEDQALAQSPSIAVAQARIREARAKLTEQRASLLPSLKASALYAHAKLTAGTLGGGSDADAGSSTTLNIYNLGTTASWEPDLFGGRRATEEARATLDARFADLADAQVTLSADIAETYVNLRDTQARLYLSQQSLDLQTRQLALTRQRARAGTASSLDVARLENQLESTSANLVPLQGQVEEYMDQLATLTGQVPGALDAMLSERVPVPLPPQSVAISDPANLLANRPDIRSAERSLAASTADIGVAKAKLMPSLSFSGILGLGGDKASDMVDFDKLTTLIAPQLSWNIFDFGKTRAAVRQSKAARDEAEANYDKTVLEALRDAETSLSRFGQQREQLARLGRAEAAAQSAAQLNESRVRAGTSATIDQLDIERQRLSASISVAQSKAALTNSYIAVQKSLGLGWEEQQ